MIEIYTDGSYRFGTSKKSAWAFAAIDTSIDDWLLGDDGEMKRCICTHTYPKGIQHAEAGVSVDDALSRNIDGECDAVIHALAWCDDSGIDEVTIYHDYTGLSHWYTGTWRTKAPVSIAYRRRVLSFPHIKKHFVHVKAHSGSTGNDLVDALANAALIRSLH